MQKNEEFKDCLRKDGVIRRYFDLQQSILHATRIAYGWYCTYRAEYKYDLVCTYYVYLLFSIICIIQLRYYMNRIIFEMKEDGCMYQSDTAIVL